MTMRIMLLSVNRDNSALFVYQSAFSDHKRSAFI